MDFVITCSIYSKMCDENLIIIAGTIFSENGQFANFTKNSVLEYNYRANHKGVQIKFT